MSGKRHFSHVNGIFTSNMIWKGEWNNSSDIIDGRERGVCDMIQKDEVKIPWLGHGK